MNEFSNGFRAMPDGCSPVSAEELNGIAGGQKVVSTGKFEVRAMLDVVKDIGSTVLQVLKMWTPTPRPDPWA